VPLNLRAVAESFDDDDEKALAPKHSTLNLRAVAESFDDDDKKALAPKHSTLNLRAVAESFGDDDKKALVLVSLVRLSPVIPFVWSNYLFGLTTVPVSFHTLNPNQTVVLDRRFFNSPYPSRILRP
jgi:hypothetical protein